MDTIGITYKNKGPFSCASTYFSLFCLLSSFSNFRSRSSISDASCCCARRFLMEAAQLLPFALGDLCVVLQEQVQGMATNELSFSIDGACSTSTTMSKSSIAFDVSSFWLGIMYCLWGNTRYCRSLPSFTGLERAPRDRPRLNQRPP